MSGRYSGHIVVFAVVVPDNPAMRMPEELLRLAGHGSIHVRLQICLHVRPFRTYVCMYVCTYVCMYVCMYVQQSFSRLGSLVPFSFRQLPGT